MPLSGLTQPALKFASEDAFIDFAKRPANHQRLFSEPVLLYGVPLRIELEPDRVVARNLPTPESHGNAQHSKGRFARVLEAITALFTPKAARGKQRQAPQRDDPNWVANRATDIMQNHPIFEVHDPLRAMVKLIRLRDHAIDRALLHCRDQHEAMGLAEQFADLVDSNDRTPQEKRMASKAPHQGSPITNLDTTIRALAPDSGEAEHIRRNLNNGALCRENFLGAYIGETQVPADGWTLPSAEVVDLWFAVDNKDKAGRTRHYRENGEDKTDVRPLSAEDRNRFMAGDLRHNRIRIRVRSDVACWYLISLLESNPTLPFNSLFALLHRLQAYQRAYQREAAAPHASMKPSMLVPTEDGRILFKKEAAIRLTKARWDTHLADIEKVFQLAHRLALKECTEAQAAAEIPSIFADLFTEKVKREDGQHVRVLRDPAGFLSLRDQKENLLAQLYNDELKHALLPFRTAGETPTIRQALPLPYVLDDIISLEYTLANDPTVLAAIMDRAKIRVAGHDYRIEPAGSTPDAIRVVPHEDSPSESTSLMGAALTEVLSREIAADRICRAAAARYREKAGQVLSWWQKACGDMLAGDHNGDRNLNAVSASNDFRNNTFSHFEKGNIPGTFIAVFGKDGNTQRRITLPDRNAEGHLSGEALKRRIKEGPPYNSLKELAAKWTLEYYGTEIRKDLTDALDTIIAESELGKDTPDSERAAMRRRVAGLSRLTMQPFSEKRLADFLEEPASFPTMAAAKSFAQAPGNSAYLAAANGFHAEGRTFHVVRHNDADRSLAIEEATPSFVQRVKRLFGIDDGSVLARALTAPARREARMGV